MTDHATPLASDPVAPAHGTVRDRLMNAEGGFSNAELKVVRTLLANYPAAGLTTISRLAKAAEVSDPTVLRLANRLGFDGFGDMQAALLAEVETHMRSPLTLQPAQPPKVENAYQAVLRATLARCDEVAKGTVTADYERVVALLADPKLRLLCLGGRFSCFLAGILQRCLHHLRPGTELLDGSAADISDRLADVDKRHLLVVFDYRRYQSDTVAFARQAHERGAQILLFTDTWRSPVADFAELILTAPTDTESPFDTLVTPLLQIEAVVAGLARALEGDWPDRVAALEAIRTENRITLSPGTPEPGGRTE
jgi:DNA-binding MurR/RpiR family transcriptional regulator